MAWELTPDGLFYRNTVAPFLIRISDQALVWDKEEYKNQPLPLSDLFSNPVLPAGASPAGAVMPFAGTVAPAGWLACDGSAISRATYVELFAAIGIVWGAGDGATTFNLPDLRGRFPRGAGNSGNGTMATGAAFAGGAVGAYANDQSQGHWHQLGDPSGNAASTRSLSGTGSASEAAAVAPARYDLSRAINAVTDGTNGAPRTGAETRPAAAALLMIIKT